jgi:signal transduction histidine kinase
MTLIYSSVLFALAAILLGGLYLGLSLSLRDEPVSRMAPVVELGGGVDRGGLTFVDSRLFERQVNANALESLRNFSFAALGVLFVASFGVGWVIAGRVLRPIESITAVARDIQATDLSRRIGLRGPDDELKRLADTFDAMLARLDAAFGAQRRFLADASHELRNPLAIIQTNTDLTIEDAATSAETQRRMRRLRRASERMAKLVDELLALGRLEEPALRRTTVDMRALVAEVGDEFLSPARLRGLQLEWSAPDGVVLRADRLALKRALANLLDNAVRLAPEGTHVWLAGGQEEGWAWLAVADDGPGVPPEHRERIFERFYRIDKSRSRAAGGSGLGLAIARDIVRAHDGDIQLQPGAGAGSTFVIWLPLAADENQITSRPDDLVAL